MGVRGRNINSANSVRSLHFDLIVGANPVTILDAYPARTAISVHIAPGDGNATVHIMEMSVDEYLADPAPVPRGHPLVRVTSGNDNLFDKTYENRPDNPYIGEIIAMAVDGASPVRIFVNENYNGEARVD